MRIAILHHRKEKPENLVDYSIGAFEKKWREAGHSVLHLFGPDRFVEADVALVHVDTSVVPEAYFRLARRYPVALNLGVADIRKSSISQSLIQENDAYQGPVIVKSDLNYGGLPETRQEKTGKKRWYLFWKKPPRISASLKYEIYPSKKEVSRAIWKDRSLVVERFLPEFENGSYFLRQSYFLGDRHRTWRLRSTKPIIRGGDFLEDSEIPTPPEVQRFRKAAGLDYGKIDFVEHEGRITILDVNKTVGGPVDHYITIAWLAPAIEAFQSTRVLA